MSLSTEPGTAADGAPSPPTPRRPWWEGAAPLWALAAVAGVLGAVRLGAKSFWQDEAFTAAMVDMPADRFVEVTVGRELNQVLYYLFLRPWSAVFGTGEVALRSVSVLGAVAAAVALVLLGRRLVGNRAALLAGCLLVVNPFFVRYAQEARAYTVTLAVVTGAGIALCRALERPTTGRLAVYAAVAGLSVYVHFFAGLVIAAQVLGVLLTRGPWRRLVPAWIGVAVAFAPVLTFLAVVETGEVDFVPRPTPGSAFDIVATTAGGTVQLVAMLGLAAIAFSRRHHRSGAAVLACWAVLPVALTYLYSVAVQPLFVDRFLIVALPALVLLAGAGLARLHPVAGGLVLVGLVAVSAVELVNWYGGEKQKDWRAASSFVLDDHREGDAVTFVRPHVRTSFEYYNRRAGDVVPPEAVLFPTYEEWVIGEPNTDIAPFEADDVAAAAPGHPRLWAFFTHRPGPGARGEEVSSVAEAIESHYRAVDGRDFDGLVVVLYERGPAGG
jgi:mannosyltransferase